MIVRIVKLVFRAECTSQFIALFEQKREKIAAFDGCHSVELWRVADQTDTFYTYSIWDSAVHLEQYRQSDFFRQTWAVARTYFAAPPEAHTAEKVTQK